MGNRRVSSATSPRTFASTATFPVRRQAVQDLHGHSSYVGEFLRAEAARRGGWRSQTNPGCDKGLLRIERNAVLVAGDVGAVERRLGRLAGQALRGQIDQHQMVIGASGHKLVPSGKDRLGKRLGVGDHSMRVSLEFGS